MNFTDEELKLALRLKKQIEKTPSWQLLLDKQRNMRKSYVVTDQKNLTLGPLPSEIAGEVIALRQLFPKVVAQLEEQIQCNLLLFETIEAISEVAREVNIWSGKIIAMGDVVREDKNEVSKSLMA